MASNSISIDSTPELMTPCSISRSPIKYLSYCTCTVRHLFDKVNFLNWAYIKNQSREPLTCPISRELTNIVDGSEIDEDLTDELIGNDQPEYPSDVSARAFILNHLADETYISPYNTAVNQIDQQLQDALGPQIFDRVQEPVRYIRIHAGDVRSQLVRSTGWHSGVSVFSCNILFDRNIFGRSAYRRELVQTMEGLRRRFELTYNLYDEYVNYSTYEIHTDQNMNDLLADMAFLRILVINIQNIDGGFNRVYILNVLPFTLSGSSVATHFGA